MKLNTPLVALVATTSFLLHSQAATTIASTSFENESDLGSYADSDTSSHDLVNTGGTVTDDGTVDSTISSTTAGDLAFDASFVSTRTGSDGSTALSDGDFIGVTSFTGTVGSFTDGTQGYQISDADGQLVLTFATVDVSSFTDVVVSLDYFVASTGYESTDSLSITVTSDSGTQTIFSGSEPELEAAGGVWINGSVSLADSDTFATITVAFDSNSGAEALFLDNVVVESVPEPTVSLLGGLGLLTLLRRRRA